jgi:uncharacterized protein (TIGR04141 family)
LPLSSPLDGVFLPLASEGGEPPWVPAVRSILRDPALVLVDSQSPGGLLVIDRPGGTFIVNFGHAWRRIDDEWLEKDFGRRVVLNLVARDRVLEIKAEQVFAKGHLASERAPRASSVREFGVEFDRDVVGTIEGLSSDPDIGNTVRGATSLRVYIPFPSELIPTLDKTVSLFASTEYKKEWPEIDKIVQTLDPVVLSDLEAQLDVDLASGKAHKAITLFTPRQRQEDDARVDTYVLGRMKPLAKHPYLTIDAWLGTLKPTNTAPSIGAAMGTPVHLLDCDGQELGKYSMFDCFGYEAFRNGIPYILSSGSWYEIVSSFISDTDKLIKNEIKAPSLTLPAWNEKHDERDYNSACDGKNGVLNCDLKKLFYGGGHSQFEFATWCISKARRCSSSRSSRNLAG